MKRLNLTLVGLVVMYAAVAAPAYAYLDGATGSMILQAVVAGAATILMFGRTQIARVKAFFSRTRKTQDAE